MADDKHGQSKTLFVRNLPYSYTNSKLEDVFSDIGPLKSCFVVTDQDSGKCRGFGYVKFSILEDAAQALESVKKIDGRAVHIQYANKKVKKKRFGGVGPSPGLFENDQDNKKSKEESHEQLRKKLALEASAEEKPQTSKGKRAKRKEKVIVPVKGQQQAPNPRNEGKRARLIIRNLSFKCTRSSLEKAFSEYGSVVDVNIPEKGDGKKMGFGFVQFSTKAQAGMAMSALNGKEIMGRSVAVDWALPKNLFESKVTKTVKDEDMEVDQDKEMAAHEMEEDDGLSQKEGSQVKDMDGSESSSDEEDEGTTGDSGSDEEEEESEVEKENELKSEKPERESDVTEGRTVFIRNLPFNVGNEDLEEFFSKFGNINYARIVVDHKTGLPKGSGFVQFTSKDAADASISAASEEGDSTLSLGGRNLHIALAVSREHAGQLVQKKENKKEQKDTRNLYLAREGMIRPGTEAAKGVPQADLAKRLKIDSAKRKKLRDQNVFVSSVRICIHNIPPTVGDKELRKLVLRAAGEKAAKLTECKIMRDLERLNSEGQGKSRGYAFCAFTQHEHALKALEHLNNNPDVFGDNKRPIVEFSLENRKALEVKQKRLEKSKVKANQRPVNMLPKNNFKPISRNWKTQQSPLQVTKSVSKKRKKPVNKFIDSRPLETRKAQDKVARSLHQGPLGLPSHSGAKQRHKPRPNHQTKVPAKRGFDRNTRGGQTNSKTSRGQSMQKNKFQRPTKKKVSTDNFDHLVASYKTKIMKSAKLSI